MPPRKRKLTPRLAEEICLLILEGKSLLAVSKMPGMPSIATLNRWMCEDEDFRQVVNDCRDVYAGDLFRQATELIAAVPSDTEDRAFLLEQAKQQAASMRAEANRKAPRKEWD
ncbi:hypothetical protein PIG34_001299 [Escherichia coli]|nr:hypothetical protein [Escherichia coli]EKL6420164.1 hypothetical protein [Escherichia coli]EKP8908813.1 hypothetical protein [Escherichia coli]EMA2290086.1 hypothetical protein [Escherichia coli]EMA2371490.1 hypothetical protein [Escherichia coli]